MALDYASDLVVVGIVWLGGDKALVPRTVEAASSLMHDSDIFRWMKRDANAFRLTGLRLGRGRGRAGPDWKIE
jgi:hypothetical protein